MTPPFVYEMLSKTFNNFRDTFTTLQEIRRKRLAHKNKIPMTPSAKAQELINKFREHADWNNEYGSSEVKANIQHAKACAILCCKEIIEAKPSRDAWSSSVGAELRSNTEYWQDVLKEIELL
jgi:hypothetical protein